MKAVIKGKGAGDINRIKHLTPAPQPAKSPVKLADILVPIDFSEHSLRALHVAEGLAQSAGGTITLLHVVEPVPATIDWSPLMLDMNEVVKACQKKLEALPAKEAVDPGLIARILVRAGIPWNEIVTTAEELNRDAIVIATHGFTGWKHVFMGSTAERVVRHARCPVLVVR